MILPDREHPGRGGKHGAGLNFTGRGGRRTDSLIVLFRLVKG